MNTFVLILTLVTVHGTNVYSIPGFASSDACASAALKWGADIERRFSVSPSAICAKQT